MRTILVIIFVTIGVSINAQNISLKATTKRVEGKSRDGFSVVIHDEYETVKGDWLKKLRGISKVKKRRNFYWLAELNLPNLPEQPVEAYTQIGVKDSLANLWIGMKYGDEEGANKDAEKELENYLYTYAYEYRKAQIQEQISDAERAAQFASRKHQRLITEEKNLNNRLLDTQNEKTRLEERVSGLILEIEVLMEKIETNKKDQEATYQQLEEIKKVLEGHKNRLKALN